MGERRQCPACGKDLKKGEVMCPNGCDEMSEAEDFITIRPDGSAHFDLAAYLLTEEGQRRIAELERDHALKLRGEVEKWKESSDQWAAQCGKLQMELAQWRQWAMKQDLELYQKTKEMLEQ